MAVQSKMDHYDEGNLLTQEDDDIFNMVKENESDIHQMEEDMPLAVQNQTSNSKNKGGRPKNWRKKMPLTLKEQDKRETNRKRVSYLKHRQG